MSKVILVLDEYMNQRQISRYSVAQKSGLRYDTITKYYKNRVKRYDGYILAKICDALNCDLADILCYQAD